MYTPMIDQLIRECENTMIQMHCKAELCGLKRVITEYVTAYLACEQSPLLTPELLCKRQVTHATLIEMALDA